MVGPECGLMATTVEWQGVDHVTECVILNYVILTDKGDHKSHTDVDISANSALVL